MTQINDLSDIIQLSTNGSAETIFFYKDNRIGASAAGAGTTGRVTSLWNYNGNPSSTTATPGATMVVPTNATNGGLKQTNPTGGKQKWLLGVQSICLTAGTLVLYDRLLHGSALSGTVTTAQSCAGVVTRYTGTESKGNQIWAEIYTIVGASLASITCSYVNQDGNSATTQATSIGSTGLREATRMIQLPLASGDSGVREIVSVTLSTTTGTAGDFGITVVRPLAVIPIALAGVGAQRDLIAGAPGVTEIKTDACLAFMLFASTTTQPQLFGSVQMVDK